MDERAITARHRHDGLLGTVIEVRIVAEDAATCERVDALVVAEVERLSAVFSEYDDSSELNRWKRGDEHDPSPEFVEVMAAAADWQRRSDGAFNPMSGVLSDMWRNAARDDERPDTAQLLERAARIREPRFHVTGGVVVRTGECDALNLNAIAKGYIVDRAVDRAFGILAPSMLLVSAGGDLLHRGRPAARIGIENPLRPYDNEPPLVQIDVADAAVATSAGSHRYVRVGTQRFSHVIDPRTGEPVDAQASVSVVADTAMTADVLATVLGMTDPEAAIGAADSYEGIACLVVGTDGRRWTNGVWADRFGDPTVTGG